MNGYYGWIIRKDHLDFGLPCNISQLVHVKEYGSLKFARGFYGNCAGNCPD